MLFGVNPLTPILMEILGLDGKDNEVVFPENWDSYEEPNSEDGEKYIKDCIENKFYPTGRFRDIYFKSDENKIVLYTRNGGGNRDSYFYIFDILKTHPNYITDYDDDFDSTYAYIEFSVPEKFEKILKDLVIPSEIETVHDKFTRIYKEMESMSKEQFEADKRFKGLSELFGKIVSQIDASKKESTS